MDAKTRAMLNDAEQELLRATTVTAMRKLDEDALVDLHDRVRRARTKYIKLHRRRGASQVAGDRSRTRADAAGARTAVKAEAFEEALGRVSAQLATVATKAAAALKKERLAAAASTASPAKLRPKATKAKTAGRSARPSKGGSTKTGRARSAKPVEKKQRASRRATQKRTTATRDARN